MADTKQETPELLNETVPADEADSLRGWTAQQGPEPPPNARELPQQFVQEQLPLEENMEEYGLTIPENQIADTPEVLDPADQVRLGNPDYASPLGVVANPEGAHIPGESKPDEVIRAAPELAQDPEAQAQVSAGAEGDAEAAAEGEGEEDLNAYTKAELEEMAAEQGIHVTSSMTKAEMIEAIEAGPAEE